MAADENDPSRTAVRLAESVVALARAEIDLAVAEARATAARLATDVAVTVVATYTSALATVIIILTPMFWALRPSAAIATVAITLSLTAISWIVALSRWRARGKSKRREKPHLLPAHPHGGTDHAVSR